MNFAESFRVALDMLRLHKLRAFLTMLGVIIGVMSVTLIMMATGAFNYFLTHKIKELGSDTIIVFYDPSSVRRGDTLGGIEGLTREDVAMLEERVQSIEMASGLLEASGRPIRRGDEELRNPRIYCTDEKQAKLSRVGIERGRGLTETDLETRANICVIGNEVVERLFGKEDPLGKLVNVGGLTLEVVGQMKRVDILGQSNGRDVWIPLTTAQDKWLGSDRVSYITARPRDGATVEQAMDDIWRVLMLKSNNRKLYRVDSRESIIGFFGAVVGVSGTLLAAIAALSLLVGGIWIMNIMLVSVTERTREIGLRKAVGAQRGAVLNQFLVEAAVLGMVGGMIGMGIAWGVGQVVTIFTAFSKWPDEMGLPMPFPITYAILAALFSAVIGMVFGIYPAARAASLSPIEALRTE
jgi:putative ABC transport system permease protein